MKNIVKLTLFIAFLSFSLFGEKLSIATGLEDGFYNKEGKEIIKQCSNKFKLSLTENISTSGSSENIRKLVDREVDFAIVQLDTLHFFRENFDSKLDEKIKVIAPLFYENIFLITKDINIKQYSDLDNQKVLINSYRSGGYTTYLNFKKSLELNWKAVESEKDSFYDFKNRNDIKGLFFVSKSTKEDIFYNDDLLTFNILEIEPNAYLNQLYKYDFDNHLYQIPALLVASKTAKKEDIQRLQSCIDQENLSELDEKVNWSFFNYESNETAEKEYQFFTELKSNRELFDINHKNGQGKSLLTLAVENNQLEKAKELLNTNIDINSQDIHGNTALHYLFKKSDSDKLLNQKIELLNIFISKKAKLNIQNKKLETPVFNWIRNTEYDTYGDKITAILQNYFKKQDLKVKNSYKNNLLHFAIFYAKPKIAEYLINLNDKYILNAKNLDGNTPFTFLAIYLNSKLTSTFLKDKKNIFNLFFERKAKINKELPEVFPIYYKSDNELLNNNLNDYNLNQVVWTNRISLLTEKQLKEKTNNLLIFSAMYGNYELLKKSLKIITNNLKNNPLENLTLNAKRRDLLYESLKVASVLGHTNIVQILINTFEEEGIEIESPLFYASSYNQQKIYEMLVNRKPKSNPHLTHYVAMKNFNKVSEFLDKNETTEEDKGISLRNACDSNNIEMVEYLIQRGVNINFEYLNIVEVLIDNLDELEYSSVGIYTPLKSAIKNNFFELFKLLIKNGAKFTTIKTASIKEPLLYASKMNNLKVVKYLVSNGANINVLTKEKETALILASENGHFDIVKYLVENGADINMTNENNESALILASKNNHFDIVKYLVENGADLNKKNKKNQTALNMSLNHKTFHLEIIKYLVNNGAYIGSILKDKQLPLTNKLMFFTLIGNLERVKQLVKNGANVNEIGKKNGLSALYLASITGNLKIVKYLVENGADIKSITKEFDEVVQKLFDNDNFFKVNHSKKMEILKYLVQKGAKVSNYAIQQAQDYKCSELVKFLEKHRK